MAGITTIHASVSAKATDARKALTWFLGSSDCASELSSVRWKSPATHELVALLPYILDPFGLTTRRALIAGRACATERGCGRPPERSTHPVTSPRHLVERVVKQGSRRIIDPACGAGVFLRAAYTSLRETLPARSAVEHLYGVDIEPAAIDACALVVVHDWLRRESIKPDETPADRFCGVSEPEDCERT